MVLNHCTRVDFALTLNFFEIGETAVNFIRGKLLKNSFLCKVATSILLDQGGRTFQLGFANLRSNVQEKPKSEPRLNLICRPQHKSTSLSHIDSVSMATPETLYQDCCTYLSIFEHFHADQSFELAFVNCGVKEPVLI